MRLIGNGSECLSFCIIILMRDGAKVHLLWRFGIDVQLQGEFLVADLPGTVE